MKIHNICSRELVFPIFPEVNDDLFHNLSGMLKMRKGENNAKERALSVGVGQGEGGGA